MDRRILSDEQWERIAPLLPGKDGDPGRSGRDNREFVEAVLWMSRTGAPWRDLPAGLGRWNSVYQRFRRWSGKDVFRQLLQTLSCENTVSEAQMDGTHVRVHQHGSGALKKTDNSRSVGPKANRPRMP